MKRNNLPAVLVAVLLFGLGVVVGALAHRYYSPTVVVANNMESFRQSYISEMRQQLALTPVQVKTLQGILDETKAQMKAIRDRSRPEMMQVRQQQSVRIREILQPSQIAAYDKLMADREQRFREQEVRDREENQRHHGGPPSSR